MPPPTMMKSVTRMLSYHSHFMASLRVDVTTASRPYAVTIGEGLLDEVGATIDTLKLPARRFVVSSPLVWRLHGGRLAHVLGSGEPILVADGERNKQLPTVTRIYDALLRANADRASALV